LTRYRPLAVLTVAAALALVLRAPEARAAAEIHRLNLVISAIPTSIQAASVNDALLWYNRTNLDWRGLEGLDKIGFAWLYQGELQYFVRQNIAVKVGAGQIRSITAREYLPRLNQDIQLRAEVLSVPVHAGAAFYFPPYNQGDFQARAFLGGGMLSQVYNKFEFQQVESGTDSSTTLGGSVMITTRGDSPGYYAEAGVHMFFALRYSVQLGLLYRSAVARELLDRDTREPLILPNGKSVTLDTGGVGAKMAVAIGF
jgi:hypothetical protein